MKIGIDIDNTIAPTFKTIIKYMNEKYKTKKKSKHSKKPSGYDLFHSNFNSFYNDWIEFTVSKDHEEMKPIKGSIKIIKNLSEKHEIYIITARANTQKIPTILWIDKHYKNKIKEVLFLNYSENNNQKPIYTKGDLCTKFDIDLIIEDDITHVYEILEKKPNTIVFLFNKNNQYS